MADFHGGAKACLPTAESDWLHAVDSPAISAGMRQGEQTGLRWRDVDFDGCAINVRRTLEQVGGSLTLKEPKTVKARHRIDLPVATVAALNEHRKRTLAEGQPTRRRVLRFVRRLPAASELATKILPSDPQKRRSTNESDSRLASHGGNATLVGWRQLEGRLRTSWPCVDRDQAQHLFARLADDASRGRGQVAAVSRMRLATHWLHFGDENVLRKRRNALRYKRFGQVAQLVEHGTENPGVGSSTLPLSTFGG